MTDRITLLEKKLAREIKARQQAEHLLEAKSEELYETLTKTSQSEALLQSALSNMLEGFLVTDMNTKILLVNNKLKSIYPQYAPFMHVGTNLKDYFHVFLKHPAYVQMIEEQNNQCSFEIQLQDNYVIAVLVKKSKQNIIVSTHKDITNDKAIISEQQQTIVKLMKAQKLEYIGKMVSSFAHDFNNIIAAIKGYNSFLKEDVANEPILHNSIDKIQEATNRAEEMVKNILDISQHAKPQLEKLDIISLIKDTIVLVKPNIPKHILIDLNLSDRPVFIKGNASQLAQVFINLLHNIKNATGNNKCNVTIDYKLVDQVDLNQPNYKINQFMPKDCNDVIAGLHVFKNKCIKIGVYDNGPGMSENIINNIFKMFFTTKKSNIGTGLGLYSIATTITDHNGGVKVYSKPNNGTYIELVIPLLESSQPITYKRKEQPKTLQDSDINLLNKPESFYKSRILIIDDNQEVGLVIHQILLRHGFNAVYIDSAQSGLDKILKDPNRWKIIICDQKMPGIFGLEILNQIRFKNILTPFVLTSGYVDEYISDPNMKLVNQVLPKPISQKLLLEVVKKYM